MNSTLENYLVAKNLSNTTIKAYNRSTLNFIAWLGGENIETENVNSVDVTSYLNYLKKKGLVNLTRSIQLNVLKHFFDYQLENGIRTINPATHLKIRGSKRKMLYPALSGEDLDSIYQKYEAPTIQHKKAKCNWFTVYKLSRQRNKTILGLMVWQGLTTPEINRFTMKDMNLTEGKIHIASSRKSAERVLDLRPEQVFELIEYQQTTRKEILKYCNAPSEYFYLSAPASGQKMATGKSTLNIWKRLSYDVGKLNPHFINFKQVRASVITHWLAQYNLRQVQYMAGHKYVSTTENYLVNHVKDLQADIEQFHPII